MLVLTSKANPDLSFEGVSAGDLAGRDVHNTVKMSVINKVITIYI